MNEARKSAKIDFGEFSEISTNDRFKIDKSTTKAGIIDAAEAGFTGRSDKIKIDGRTLRKSGRSAQLNIKLKPETKNRFLRLSQNYTNTEEFVCHLLDIVENNK